MTFIGILILVLSIAALFVQKAVLRHSEGKTDILPGYRRFIPYTLALFSLFFIFNPWSINDAGNRQVVQTIGGDLEVRFEPGLYWSGPASKVTTWPNNFTIQVSREENKSPDADLWIHSNIKDGTFSEGDNAELEHTVKWDMPAEEQLMLDLHKTYNNFENLMSTTLLSYQKKIASFSTQRMSSEAHYSGGKSQLDQYFQDQLRNGQVLLETSTKTRTLQDSTRETYIDVKPRLNSDGSFLRVKSDIQTFGILSTYTSMDNVHYTPEIDLKLKQKIKYAADKANSKQELIAAQQEEQTAIVQGRKKLAVTTAREESAELEAVIQARKAKLVAKEQAEQAVYIADKIAEEGRAQAEANRALVAAGLTPVQQMNMNIEIARVTSANIAEASTPQIVIMGGGEGASDEVMNIFGAERSLELMKKMSKGGF